MHGNKTKPGAPCRNGHPHRRDKSGRCVLCRRASEKRRRKAKRPPAYLATDGRAWIWYARRRLQKRSAGVRPSIHDLVALWDRQGRVCGLTGLPIEGTPHLDHKIPVSIGGRNGIDNLHWVSDIANHAKNSRSVGEFRAWLLAAADSLRKKIAIEELL